MFVMWIVTNAVGVTVSCQFLDDAVYIKRHSPVHRTVPFAYSPSTFSRSDCQMVRDDGILL